MNRLRPFLLASPGRRRPFLLASPGGGDTQSRRAAGVAPAASFAGFPSGMMTMVSPRPSAGSRLGGDCDWLPREDHGGRRHEHGLLLLLAHADRWSSDGLVARSLAPFGALAKTLAETNQPAAVLLIWICVRVSCRESKTKRKEEKRRWLAWKK